MQFSNPAGGQRCLASGLRDVATCRLILGGKRLQCIIGTGLLDLQGLLALGWTLLCRQGLLVEAAEEGRTDASVLSFGILLETQGEESDQSHCHSPRFMRGLHVEAGCSRGLGGFRTSLHLSSPSKGPLKGSTGSRRTTESRPVWSWSLQPLLFAMPLCPDPWTLCSCHQPQGLLSSEPGAVCLSTAAFSCLTGFWVSPLTRPEQSGLLWR